jgi:hypothetical protein
VERAGSSKPARKQTKNATSVFLEDARPSFRSTLLENMAVSKDRRNDRQSNQLLGALETASRKRIDPHLEPIKLGLGDMVCEAGGLLKHAYFPEGAVLSLLTVLENGSAIETANIGREGAFGLFAAMYSRVSFNRLYCAAGGRHGSLPNRIVAIGMGLPRWMLK